MFKGECGGCNEEKQEYQHSQKWGLACVLMQLADNKRSDYVDVNQSCL